MYTVPERLKESIFNRFGNQHNGYVFLLIFRRKWLINNRYQSDEEARKLFPSSEMCLGKCYVPGHEIKKRLDYKIGQLLSLLDERYGKEMIFKGNKYFLPEIYNNYPDSISLLFTFPRDVIKASKKLIKKSFDTMLSSDNLKIINLTQHLDQEWISSLQATSDRKTVFGLIDIDYNLVQEYNSNYTQISQNIFKLCESLNFKLIYCVTTISGGVHLIIKLNPESGKLLFSKEYYSKTLLEIQRVFKNIDATHVEIGTTANKITHLPFNRKIVDLLSLENRR